MAHKRTTSVSISIAAFLLCDRITAVVQESRTTRQYYKNLDEYMVITILWWKVLGCTAVVAIPGHPRTFMISNVVVSHRLSGRDCSNCNIEYRCNGSSMSQPVDASIIFPDNREVTLLSAVMLNLGQLLGSGMYSVPGVICWVHRAVSYLLDPWGYPFSVCTITYPAGNTKMNESRLAFVRQVR